MTKNLQKSFIPIFKICNLYYFEAITEEADTPIRPEKHVTTPKISGILKILN